MEYNIRQLSFGEVFDRSLRILVDNAVLLIAIATVLGIPMAAISSTAAPTAGAVPVPARIAGVQVILLIFALLVAPIVHAALTTAVADTYLNKPVTIASAYREAWAIALPFIGTYLLMYLIILLAGGVSAFVGYSLGRATRSGVYFATMVLILVVGAIYIVIRWALIGPIMIVERKFGFATLSRSGELVSGAWWRTCGVLIVAALIAKIPLSALSLIWSSIPVLAVILSGLVEAIGYAFGAVAVLVYYFDRRCRIEDFDLRRLAEQIRSEGAPESQSMKEVPTA